MLMGTYHEMRKRRSARLTVAEVLQIEDYSGRKAVATCVRDARCAGHEERHRVGRHA